MAPDHLSYFLEDKKMTVLEPESVGKEHVRVRTWVGKLAGDVEIALIVHWRCCERNGKPTCNNGPKVRFKK